MGEATARMPLTELLLRLARDWSHTNKQYENGKIKRAKEVQRRRIARRKARGAQQTKQLRQNSRAIEEEAERENDAVHLHPFPDVIRRIVTLTGFKEREIRDAANCGFEGAKELVATLNQLDRDEKADWLFRALSEQHSLLAAKIGLTAGVPSETGGKAVPEKMSVNERMFATLGTRPESKEWSAQQWADHLNVRSKSTVAETDAWNSLKVIKADDAIKAGAKPIDRRRKKKASNQSRER